ncbi:hypothetical protein EDC01DRAFT_626636 [Geopyxis carbonaria]|nr:hypothetical protein EDC01DRAFT_626636 [Geopyxis carbonaria]
MNRSSRPEVLDLQQKTTASFNRARSRSTSSVENPLSSNPSTSSLVANPLLNVSPEPAYIAPSAAARLVTSDHEGFFQSLYEDGIIRLETPTMFVAPESLKLVNQFLDFLLYSFFATSKSTCLSSLRPAVAEVLRLRLAKEAVAGADQELQSYLGGEDETDLTDVHDGQHPTGAWDAKTAWRKARVQCMVYSSLGDLEEDDEVFYTEDGLEGNVGLQQYQSHSSVPGAISPAVAIWLTSILEFIGEQTLLVAGHATIARYSAQRIAVAATMELQPEGTFPNRPTVEELDTEKVALNPSLGRMWRQWRKKVRGSRGSLSMSFQDVVVLQQDRPESTCIRVSSGSDYSSKEEILVPKFNADNITTASDGEGQTGPPESTKLVNELMLTPIVESQTPTIRNMQEQELESTNSSHGETVILKVNLDQKVERRRPQSLILLPWTHESPFTLSPSHNAIRRPCSLPDLKRGDFADPNTEGNEGSEDEITDIEGETEPFIPSDIEDIESIESDRGCLDPDATLKLEVATDISPQLQVCTVPNMEESISQHHRSEKDQENNPPELPGHLLEDEQFEEISATVHADREIKEIQTPTTGDIDLILNTETPDSLIDVVHRNLAPQAREASGTESSPQTFQNQKRIDKDNRTSQYDGFEAPSNGYVQDEQSSSPRVDIGQDGADKPGSRPPSHLKQSSSSSKHSQISERKIGQLNLVPTSNSMHSIGSDRSTGVRVFTPPATPDHSRRSSSFSKMQRPIHTSGSTSSQTSTKLKSFIPWPNDSGKHTRVQESDNESRSSLHSDRLASLDDKERSFEELISGDGTIHCTITPDPIRNMILHGSPPHDSTEKRAPTADLADFLKNTSPDGSRIPESVNNAKVQPLSHCVPLTRSISAETRPAENSPSLPITPHPYTQVEQSVHSTPVSSKSQHVTGSIVDGVSMLPSPKIGKFRVPPSTGLPAIIRQTRSDSPITSVRAKNRLLAREASGSTGSDTTSALADFFRNTKPPVDGQDVSAHRISRSVAPFRNTMDSTQFDGNSEVGIVEDTNKEQSFSTSSALHESYQSSFNSSTALLRSNSKKTRDYGSTVGVAGPDIKRKQTRQRDPYAIDMEGLDDDGEEDDMLDLVLPKKREEESLIDFLKNAPPPPPITQPPIDDPNKIIQKKASSISLISRFGRNSNRKNSISSNSVSPVAAGLNPKYVPLRIDNDTLSVNSDTEIHRRPSATAARANFDAQYPISSSRMNPRSSNKLNQPRGGRTERNDTDSLSDFLKHTAPPESRASSNSPQKEGSRSMFKKISFSRGKKSNELAGVV